MSPLWLIPGVVVLIGSAAILGLLRSAAEEARLLHDELTRQRELAESARRLGAGVRTVGRPFRDRL